MDEGGCVRASAGDVQYSFLQKSDPCYVAYKRPPEVGHADRTSLSYLLVPVLDEIAFYRKTRMLDLRAKVVVVVSWMRLLCALGGVETCETLAMPIIAD